MNAVVATFIISLVSIDQAHTAKPMFLPFSIEFGSAPSLPPFPTSETIKPRLPKNFSCSWWILKMGWLLRELFHKNHNRKHTSDF